MDGIPDFAGIPYHFILHPGNPDDLNIVGLNVYLLLVYDRMDNVA